MAAHYPVFLDVRGRGCVVLGDGDLADDKAEGLRAAGARVLHLRRPYRPGDLDGAFLAIEATGDVASQAAARRAADRGRVLLNVVDVPSRCDWIAPAVVRRGPLQIAVSTAGESPFIASALRERLERDIGEEWAQLTELVGAVRRRLRRRGVPATVQRHVYRRLLRSEIRSLLRRGKLGAARAVAAAIESRALRGVVEPGIGEVVLVGAGPGSPGLITVEGRDVLAHADVVFHDALVDRELLRLCGAATRLVDVGKRAGRPSASQDEINRMLVAAAHEGMFVVRLKGGDPFLFGRGGEEVAAIAAAGIPVRVIPGVSAALAAPVAAGIPLTLRGVAGSVAVVTGQRAAGAQHHLERLAQEADTLVVLMPGDLEALAATLARALGSERPAALIFGATTAQQRVLRSPIGRIAALAQQGERGAGTPATLVVGDVVEAASGDAALEAVSWVATRS